jgi:hypothetical protein
LIFISFSKEGKDKKEIKRGIREPNTEDPFELFGLWLCGNFGKRFQKKKKNFFLEFILSAKRFTNVSFSLFF